MYMEYNISFIKLNIIFKLPTWLLRRAARALGASGLPGWAGLARQVL